MKTWRGALIGLCVPLWVWSCDDEDSVRETGDLEAQDGGEATDARAEAGDGAADADAAFEDAADGGPPVDAADDASDAAIDDAGDADAGIDDPADADAGDAPDGTLDDGGDPDADVDDAGDGQADAGCCVDALDWDSAQYPGVSQAATLQLACGATVALTIDDPDNTLTAVSPAVGTTLNGPSTSNGTLGIGVQDLVTGTSAVFAFDFAQLPGGSIPDLSFPIYDVDRGLSSGTYEERVRVRAFLGGSSVAPAFSFDASFVQSIDAATVQGTNTADPDTDDGTVLVTFSSPVDRLEVEFSNGPGASFDPGFHGIAIGDLSFGSLCQ